MKTTLPDTCVTPQVSVGGEGMIDAGSPDVWLDAELTDALVAELEAHQRGALEQLADETDAAWAAWLDGGTPYGTSRPTCH